MALAALALSAASRAAGAQADVIRGRITGDRGQPLANATITATSTSGGVSRVAATDADGRFTITFAGGDGDYWLNITALGFTPRRMQLRRVADQEILVADARLAPAGVALDPVKINAPRKRAEVDTSSVDIGGSEFRVNVDAVTAEQLADLALLAGTLPGVQIIPNADGGPSGYSVFGLGPEQNETTLNGMRFGGSALPRDAGFDATLATSPYDVSRGGFSGAQLALRSRAPTNLTLRANSVAFDAPWLQWTDPVGRSLGQDFGSLSIGGVVTSPIKHDRVFAHLAYQLGRRFSHLTTLLDADAAGLRAAGLAADSVQRLLSVLNQFGVPATVGGLPAQRLSEQGLVYGSLDFTSPTASSGQALNLTYTGNWNRQRPTALSSTSLPSHGGERQGWQGSVQARHTRYFGFGILSETQLAVAASNTDGSPYLNLPNAIARINSQFADGERSVGTIAFGGSSSLDREQRTTGLAAMNHLSWFSLDNEHRLRLTTELARESIAERLAANSLGTFQFNSLADVEAGQPVAFRRQLTAPGHDFANYIGAVSLGDAYAPTSRLQLTFGVRADVNHFDTAPTFNPQLEQLLGTRNDRAPNRLRFSPRLGFSYAGGAARQQAAVEGAARQPGVTIRGGVGIFQGLASPASLGPMLDNTGLGSGAQQIACVGAATPIPDWSRYRADPSSIPAACADGSAGTVFSNDRPSVSVFAPSYSAPRSLRSNVAWSSQILGGRFNARADLTYSLNLEQTGIVDLNFAPNARFGVANEGNRPVFVPASSIVAQSGVVSTNLARRSDQFARVSEFRSDLRSEARQLALSLSPAGFHTSVDWNITYVASRFRDQLYGFNSTGGNPFDRAWGRSWLDGRHQFVYTLGYNFLDAFRLSWAGSVRSGSPYTPMVAGDINGDGNENDRAFVFSPARMPDADAAAAMTTLLRDAPASVRDCLTRQTGSVAARNSCEGPWTSAASLTIALNPVRWWRSNRLDILFQVANPLGAADLALHGSGSLRGWGQPATPDATLYYVRGFDPATQRFHYEVNRRFGSTAPATSTVRAPVVFTGIVRVDVGPTRERQTLTQQLDRGRRASGQKMPEAVLKGFYGTGGLFNPIGAILRVADSISLTGPQADSITVLNRDYTRELERIWTPIAKELAALPDDYDTGTAYSIYVRGRRETIDRLSRIAPLVRGLLTREQLRGLPTYALAHLDTRYLATIRTGTAGLGLTFLPGISAPRSAGGGGGTATVSTGR